MRSLAKEQLYSFRSISNLKGIFRMTTACSSLNMTLQFKVKTRSLTQGAAGLVEKMFLTYLTNLKGSERRADHLLAVGHMEAQLQHISQHPLQHSVALWLISLQWRVTELGCLGHTTPHTCSSIYLPLPWHAMTKTTNHWSDIRGYILSIAEQHHPEFRNDRAQQRHPLPTPSTHNLEHLSWTIVGEINLCTLHVG